MGVAEHDPPVGGSRNTTPVADETATVEPALTSTTIVAPMSLSCTV